MNRQRSRRYARHLSESLVVGSLLALSCLRATPLARALHARFPAWNKAAILLGALALVLAALIGVLQLLWWLLDRSNRH